MVNCRCQCFFPRIVVIQRTSGGFARTELSGDKGLSYRFFFFFLINGIIVLSLK